MLHPLPAYQIRIAFVHYQGLSPQEGKEKAKESWLHVELLKSLANAPQEAKQLLWDSPRLRAATEAIKNADVKARKESLEKALDRADTEED